MSTVEIVSKLDSAGRGLKIRFSQREDRYAHSVLFVDGDNEFFLLESLEGDDREDWPPSPALQQLTQEERPDGSRVLLLVGMAGTSHWSLSIEPHAAEPGFLFDVACRIKGGCGPLGSQYRCHATTEHPRGPHTLEIGVADQGVRCESESAGDEGPASLAIAEAILSLLPSPPTNPPPATARWKYRVTLVP